MKVNDTISLTKEQFLRLAPLGLVVKRAGYDTLFGYTSSPRYYSTSEYPEYIPGYVYFYDWNNTNEYQPINGIWTYFENSNTQFVVVKPPITRIAKTKELL